MKTIAVLTGAGMSAESGINTFRDSDGLWENHRVEDVATIDAWYRNPKLVLDFYNERRRQLVGVEPNRGHLILHELEKNFDVQIITQNVDNLHERAGSSHVIHLHGELTKACNEHKTIVKDIAYNEIHIGQKLGDTQMRPFIVWFGEAVPEIERAMKIVETADIVVIIGTSLQVYPAAGLINYAPKHSPIYYIDPKGADILPSRVHLLKKGASEGLEELKNNLLANR
ncbi:MAG: NAD-dependent deacylase [Prevotellaceae bacterium]|jgi:NAD-dependent deacetylase|nr:NAD-dependent deacylase [Prevotellaceae bacterium]